REPPGGYQVRAHLGEAGRCDRPRRQGTRDVSGARKREAAVRRETDRRRVDGRSRMSIEAKGPSLTAAPAGSSTFWTMDRVADALKAEAGSPSPRGSHVFGRVWTDTRTLPAGDVFVALSGGTFDAHE